MSWYRPHLERSLAYRREARLSPDAALIDVGAGASTFVDDALAMGFADVTVLDLSEAALLATKRRLGPAASTVDFRVADITRAELPAQRYDFWYERAVFYFLADPADRARYVAIAQRALKPGAHIVVATFAPDGPERCSGLEVARFDADAIHDAFGTGFEKVGAAEERHLTPWGSEQAFVYCYCRVRSVHVD